MQDKESELIALQDSCKIDKGENSNNKLHGNDNGNGDPTEGKNQELKYVFGYTNKHCCTKFISPSQIDLPIEMLMQKYSGKVITPSAMIPSITVMF